MLTNQPHKISNTLWRMSLSMLLVLISALSGFAEGVPTAVKPKEGAGTVANPYLVSTVAEFMYVNSALSSHFKQTKDLDFTGYEFKNTVINNNFTGTYDGNGYTIKNIKIDWTNPPALTSSYHYINGIFKSVTGNIRNLILDNIQLTQTDGNNEKYKPTGKNETVVNIGVLCGNIYSGGKVENVIIKNSKISAGDNDLNATNYFVGGLVGDIRSTAGGSDEVADLVLKNIYAQVDFDLHNCTRHKETVDPDVSRPMQFNVGGIVGRLRTVPYNMFPINTYYEGTINAPLAMIGPCYAASRINQKSVYGGYITTVYAGHIKDPGNPASLKNPADNSILGAEGDAGRFFSNYKIKHINEDTKKIIETEITDILPSRDNCLYGTRALKRNDFPYKDKADGNSKIDYNKPADMLSFQGVNHGTYDASADKSEVLSLFNEYAENNGLLTWSYDVTRGFGFNYFSWSRIAYNKFEVTIGAIEKSLYDNYKFRWTLTKVPTSRDESTIVVDTDIDSNGKSVLDFTTLSELKHINHYSKVKVELVSVSDSSVLQSGEVGIQSPAVSVLRTSELTFRANVESDRDDVDFYYKWQGKYRDTWQVLDGGSGNIKDTKTNVYNFGSKTLPYAIDFTLYDKDDRVLHSVEGDEISASIPVSDVDLSLLSLYTIDASRKGDEIIAVVKDGEGKVVSGWNDTEYVSDPNISFLWEVNTDPSNHHDWTLTKYHDSHIKAYASDIYYRVTWVYSGWSVGDAVYGNKRMVFVYSKEISDKGRDKGYTSFAGIDQWTDSEGYHEVEYPDGDDANDGRDPYHAVKTMKRAYELCQDRKCDGSNAYYDDNIIVIMGHFQDPNEKFLSVKHEDWYVKPVTITGKRGKSITDGSFAFWAYSDEDNGAVLSAPTQFENLKLRPYDLDIEDIDINSDVWSAKEQQAILTADNKKATMNSYSHRLYLYARCHDLVMGEGLSMLGYSDHAKGNGLLDADGNLPDVHIIGAMLNSNVSTVPDRPNNKIENVTSITVKSGAYARIIGAGRNNQRNTGSNNIIGSPLQPYRLILKIDLQDNYEHDYVYDIGLLTGGQTDGTVFGDAEIEIAAGSIGRYISGNISYGRSAVNSPSDSYFGSTVLTFRGGNIKELYGGSLGRHGDTSTNAVEVIQAYFYGRSIINIEGGTVGSNLYGSGAGGVAGIGTDLYHTDDKYIPYFDTDDKKVLYGDYAHAKGKVPTMTLLDGTIIDFNKTYNEINVRYGTVKGNIYGAGGGYSKDVSVVKASDRSGNLYGDCYVRISEEDINPTLIEGSVYGGGAGSDQYYNASNTESDKAKFKALAQLYGNTTVEISGGTIKGDVYGGAQGIEKLPDMAAVYGTTNLSVSGGTIYGNIYGGSAFANMRRYELSEDEAISNEYKEISYEDSGKYYIKETGETNVTINSGTIGNCIFGGSKGNDLTKAIIESDTHVTINGGDFLDYPYIELGITDEQAAANDWNTVDTPDKYRSFNIYGGGNVNCDILGTAYVKVYSSLLKSENSFVPMEQNPNALTEHNVSRFQGAYMDITYRRFCVYGGGYGLKTNVMNTDVYVTIPPERPGVTKPHGFTLDKFLDHQSFFDIAGGGYSGDVGHWADENGISVKDIDITGKSAAEVADLYHHYVGGKCKVTIDGYTYARKIIGGGFYGSCRSTNTHVLCGSLRQVYGGSLLGYVHDKALLQFGNRVEDFLRKTGKDASGKNIYEFDAIGYYGPHVGDFPEYEGDKTNVSDDIWRQAEARAKEINDFIFITEDIYGGNDVKGIIGTKKWQDELTNEYGTDPSDGGPLFQTDITSTEEKGIVFNIYGGTFMGNVYSAGNGHYRGYYVPEWVRYNDGPARMYREVISSVDHTQKAKVYRSRPMVGCVNVNIRGNSQNDYVKLHRNFYGGGSECTIGQFNTLLPLEDPRRMVKGGHLHVNFGGFTQIDGNVYMGAEGETIGTQYEVPEGIDLKTFIGSTSKELARLGTVAYDHWYYDEENHCYLPGFPAPGKVDGNFGMTGRHMLHSYMQNVQMQGDVETTFYRNLYERDENGGFKYFKDENDKEIIDATGNHFRVRKHWSPGELATKREFADENDPDRIYAYNAEGITFNSFYLGGLSGTMTNNNLMVYCYANHIEADPEKDDDPAHDHEQWGSIYRVTLPQGVTIRDKVVMGSENATVHYHPYSYSPTQTTIDAESENGYIYEGGLITQRTYSFDLIVYNDAINHGRNIEHYLPSDFYRDDIDKYKINGTHIKDLPNYKLQYGANKETTIYRKVYDYVNMPAELEGEKRFGLATTDSDHKTAYLGPREKRQENGDGAGDNKKTVSKLTLACKFDPLETKDSQGREDHSHHYGGNVYGGCYRSGIVIGNVVINIGSNLLGDHVDVNSASTFGDISSLKYNIGRVFGGGFGEDTRIEGDTYINLLNNFRGMNVFGGGMKGDVTGTAHINYIGSEDNSFVFGAIYGGGLKGSVGSPQYLDEEKKFPNLDATKQSTIIRLFSGNVDKVYGGSCMGNLYGRTFVELCDAVVSGLDHLDASRMNFDWASSRLVVGTVYGGNDITGVITPYKDPDPYTGTDKEVKLFRDFSTSVYVHEVANKSQKTTPGANANGYNGFPLIGDIYGGGNGDYGTQIGEYYSSGTVIFANGDSIDTEIVDLERIYQVPNIDKAHVCIEGGSVINAYGGGDMSTITGIAKVSVDYPIDSKGARAGFETMDELTRVWNVLHFTSDEVKDEVTSQVESDGKKHPVFLFPIFRLFGGNNNADMAIQPTWSLNSGNVGSLYSGGNIGRMTYYNATPTAGEPKGLTLTIDSPNIEIDNVYGGARIGDITPMELVPKTETDPETHEEVTKYEYSLADVRDPDFYGATLNIKRGIVHHVYGGNDVTGYVSYGTNVNINGAISGDVYCAGNGNYLYKYDRNANIFDYTDESHLHVRELYEFETADYKGARYFVLPAKDAYGFDKTAVDDKGHGTSYNATDAQTVMAINSYRPNVERSKLVIAGSESNKVWVRGSVYCGGNSSTIVSPDGKGSVELVIRDNVVLNSVFLGSNGESLADGRQIEYTERLNGVTSENDGITTTTPLKIDAANDLNDSQIPDSDKNALKKDTYKTILDLYMRAVEIADKPNNFDFSPDLQDAYIGEFVVGGNRGSMLAEKIELTFPETLNIYGRIIGGSKAAKVKYKDALHIGGMTRQPGEDGDKLKLGIKSNFVAQKIEYDETNKTIELVSAYDSANNQYPNGICNVYGGCYQSGTTIGNIHIDLYSDMLHYDATDDTKVDKAAVIAGLKDGSERRNFTVFGGGYGYETTVRGDITVRMVPNIKTAPSSDPSTFAAAPSKASGTTTVNHPSAAAIFGGAQEGLVIGDTRVEVRDGKVLGNVYGASEAAVMHGSTAVIIGYPTYYTAKNDGVFSLNRSDYSSETARNNKKMANGNYAMVKSVAYKKGEVVTSNVYDMIIGRVKEEVLNHNTQVPIAASNTLKYYDIGMEVPADEKDTYMTYFTNPTDTTANALKHIDHYFKKHKESPDDIHTGLKWDDIVIWIGDQESNTNPNATFYGEGNVYGGGYIPNVANESLSFKHTVLRYEGQIYGGNTAVMIWDNPANADLLISLDGGKDSDGNALKDHLTIGSSRYKTVPYTANADKMGYYVKVGDAYEYQTSGKMQEGTTYYTKEADGGVYGGGRKVFVDGFSSVDIAYYGYADHSPENPKLLNTIQRADVVTVTDCCMELIGAPDYTIDDVNKTLYAINRVAELRMISSLSGDDDLVGHTKGTEDHIIRYAEKRSRNYIGFYHEVHDLASFYSNWTMERKYHGSDGKVSEEKYGNGSGENNRKYYWKNKEESITAYLKETGQGEGKYETEDDKFDITGHIIAKYASNGIQTYTLHKHDIVEDFYDGKANNWGGDAEKQAAALDKFNQRNVGTSGNMIGIRSGYSLRFQGHCLKDGSDTDEELYYGPVYGVTEMKLLTVAVGEGGGYVYALNHHYDPKVDRKLPWQKTEAWMSEWGHDFFMVSGNFVFPGAAYMTKKDSKDISNYIIDDCMPEEVGYDGLWAEYNKTTHDANDPYGVNSENEQHYWYVNGQIYRFNMTLTGITSDKEENFYVNTQDDIVTLMALRPGAKIRVSEVTWLGHDEGYDCVINKDVPDNYKLFFTIDHDTHNTYNTTNTTGRGAYVAQISKTSMTDTEGAFLTGYGNIDGDATKPNTPRLGIRLNDTDKSRLADQDISVGRKYYEDHLKAPHEVQVVLEAKNDGDGDLVYKYIINLSINYLLGPLVKGEVNIDNCALPGEYIYVNTKNIQVDMDESMGVTEQFYKIYPCKNGSRIKDSNSSEDIYFKVDKTDEAYKDYVVEGNESLIHIPAYYYMNGWEVAYCVTAGGQDFEITLPGFETKAIQDPADETKTITVPDESKPILENRLWIHNYHKMKPRYKVGGAPIDLKWTAGARIYIEDDEDMIEYFKYMAKVQDASASEKAIDGSSIHPQYAEGLDFYLQANVNIPTAEALNYDENHKLILKNNFHGNGKIMHIPWDAKITMENKGAMYNVGFVMEKKPDNVNNSGYYPTIYNTNSGTIENCYYYNYGGVGSLVGSTGGTLRNCYQNTPVPSGFEYNQLLQISDAGFRYGQVAYNLNGYYLQKRHYLLHGKTGDMCTENNSFALADKDAKLRTKTNADYDNYAIGYIESMFNDGEYRYAFYNLSQDYPQFTEALRTYPEPNYLDYLGYYGTANSVSMHDHTHKVDTKRWCEDHQTYRPQYDIDYLFFGQDLTVDIDKVHLPDLFSPSTRVYRVGGFYGTSADKGYFFNKQAYVDAHNMTAVDFVGYRDREMYDAGKLKSDYRSDIEDNGWVIKTDHHEVYCPPTLDLPWVMEGGTPMHDFDNLTISDNVTHNLLIYTRDNDKASTYVQNMHYDGDFINTSLQHHSEEKIRAHHIVDAAAGPKMYGDYLHIVDGHDMHVPVAFKVKQGWLRRQPADFADEYTMGTTSYKTAWEGICLPYTVKRVYAAASDPLNYPDYGEITHFYGDSQAGHEYWLRRFKGINADGELTFERPTDANEGNATDDTGTYTYTNTFFYETFKDKEYVAEHDDLYHDANSGELSRVMAGYRYLTASVPYIVTYPGDRYYEFDLSGKFYKETFSKDGAAQPQTICYFANDDASEYVEIPESATPVDYTDGGYTLKGTFLHVTKDPELAKNALYNKEDNLYVLDSTDESTGEETHDGQEFKKADDKDVVMPFRVYLTKSASPSGAPMRISGDSRGVTEPDDEEEPEQPVAPDDDVQPGIEVWAEGSALMVRTPYDVEMYVFNSIGQVVRYIKAYEGVNRYTGLPSALYIVNGTKVLIRR